MTDPQQQNQQTSYRPGDMNNRNDIPTRVYK